jgi:hypothetical protein
MKLVFVHGRAQESRSSEEISFEWMSALNRGIFEAKLPSLKVQPITPYYGDKLITLMNEARKALSPDSAKRDSLDPGYRNFLADFANEASQRVAINDDRLARHGFQVGAPKQVRSGRDADRIARAATSADNLQRGPQNWSWVIATIRALDDMFPRLSSGGIELILKDVYVYCTNDNVRDAIDDVVFRSLPSSEFVVVGHSLGSVVAYNVLQATKTKVVQFITIGSPLAINAIKQRLKIPPSFPKCVGDWYNARDRADVVALNPLTSSNFPTEPQIYNDDSVVNLSENRHHISGYLDHLPIVRLIERVWSLSTK